MIVAVTGANGQLGSDIAEVLKRSGAEVIALTHSDLEITDFVAVEDFFNRHHPDVFINTAAFHNVDQCEIDEAKAMLVNAKAPEFIAGQCRKYACRFIHISTDYVFDGAKGKPYLESDTPNPLNVYGKSKYEGENSVLAANPDALVLRVSGIYGHHPCRAKGGLNFVQLMLKLAAERGSVKVKDDEFVSPTSTLNIAEQIVELLKTPLRGIVHATSEGGCSWYEFASEIFDYTHTLVELHKAIPGEFPVNTPRPSYSILENAVLKENGINLMLHWKDALHNYLSGKLS